jgi:hypothetical protein
MATVNLDVLVETEAEVAVSVDAENVKLVAGRGRTSVESETEAIMGFTVAGNPGQKYKITLATNPAWRIEMLSGENPVDSALSTRNIRGGGYTRFVIRSSAQGGVN